MLSPKPYIYTDNNLNTIKDYEISIKRLEKPMRRIDVVLDTDMYNEVDDQFAIAYLLQNNQKLNLKAILAAPFFNHHSKDALDGMLKSYDEVFNILKLLNKEEYYSDIVYKGSEGFLDDERTARESEAVDRLIELSKNYSKDNPLYIIAIAACTNISSAIIKCPDIVNKIFVVWVGGMSFEWHDNASFNAGQDVASARVLLGSGVPLVLIPGRGVLDHLITTEPELEYWLRDKNEFCNYIIDKTKMEAIKCKGEKCWSRPISDISAVAWLLDDTFMLDRIEHAPIMNYDNFYSFDKRRLFIRYVYSVNRDKLLSDLFTKLSMYK